MRVCLRTRSILRIHTHTHTLSFWFPFQYILSMYKIFVYIQSTDNRHSGILSAYVALEYMFAKNTCRCVLNVRILNYSK